MDKKFKGNGQLSGNELINDIAKYWYWLLSSVLIFIAAAFFYRAFNPPVYIVKTVIQPSPSAYVNASYYTNNIKSINDKIKLTNTDLSAKKKKQAELKNEIALLPVNDVIIQPITDKKQKDILKAIVPYLKNAAQQYELIPTTFPIKDPSINDLISRFNKAQSDKQHLLGLNSDQATITAANNKIITLKDGLQNAIDNTQDIAFKNQSSTSTLISKNLIGDSLSAVKAAISNDINSYARLNHKKQQYEQLYKKQRAQQPQAHSIQLIAAGLNVFTIYFIAFLCGLIFPVGIIYLYGNIKKNTYEQPAEKSIDKNKEDNFVFGNITDTNDAGFQELAEKIKLAVSGRNKTILISSLKDTIDKTAICRTLAQYLAINKFRVIIVDLNFDSYKSVDPFTPDHPGIKDFIFNKVNKLDDIIISTQYRGVSTILQGDDYMSVVSNYFGKTQIGFESIDRNQKKLIVNSPKIAFMAEKLSQKFDCVLLNSTALNELADVLPLTDLTALNLIAIEDSADKEQEIGHLQQVIEKYGINYTHALLTA